MLHAVRLAGSAIVGYAIGQFPSAAIATRAAGGQHDLAEDGTGNPGAMNAAHVLGARWGAAVSIADIGKGLVAARVGRRLAGPEGASVASSAAVVGHCHPIARRGGKGVATSVGQVLGTTPAYAPVDMAVGLATAKLPWFRHRTRAATSVASAVWVTVSAVWWRRGWRNPGGPPATWALPTGAAVTSVVIAQRFRAEAERVEAHNRAQQHEGLIDDMEQRA